MFFSMFPQVIVGGRVLTDLSVGIAPKDVDDPRFLYSEYTIQDGERPDSVSNKFYGVPYYHWVILVTNGLTISSWPKSDERLEAFLLEKYGQPGQGEVHHYEDESGLEHSYRSPISATVGEESRSFWFNGDGLGSVRDGDVYLLGQPVTNREHEVRENDKKKVIRILNREFLPDVVSLAKDLLK